MFLLAFIGAYSAKAPPRVLTIVSAALSAAAVVGTVLYVFAQNWLQTLIFSDYVGSPYIVWVGLIAVLKVEDLQGRVSLGHDYGLVKATLEFSAKRNTTKHPTLNPNMFEPGNSMCQGWLYLHCGIPIGHVFEGKLELLLGVDRDGSWRVVSPHWRSRTQYPLHGYLLLEGREKEGYVLFPKQRK
jgi:hypothetical protein